MLLVLAWFLGQALALAHGFGHGAHVDEPEVHFLGGEHEEGSKRCELIDLAAQAQGESLPSMAGELPSAAGVVRAAHGPAWLLLSGPLRPGYEARAPPRG